MGQNRLDTMEGHNDLYYDEEDEVELSDGEKLDTSQEKIEVNLDDIEDEDDQECLLDYKQNEMNQAKKKADDGLFDGVDQNLFKIKESQDKGLADMETGSEVYMSELLVSNCIHFILHLGWFRHGRL